MTNFLRPLNFINKKALIDKKVQSSKAQLQTLLTLL